MTILYIATFDHGNAQVAFQKEKHPDVLWPIMALKSWDGCNTNLVRRIWGLISHHFICPKSCKIGTSMYIYCSHFVILHYLFLTSLYIWLIFREIRLTFMRHHPLYVDACRCRSCWRGVLPKWPPKIFGFWKLTWNRFPQISWLQ